MQASLYTKISFDASELEEGPSLMDQLNSFSNVDSEYSKINLFPTLGFKQQPTLTFEIELPEKDVLNIDFSLDRENVIYLKNYLDAWLKNNPAKSKAHGAK